MKSTSIERSGKWLSALVLPEAASLTQYGQHENLTCRQTGAWTLGL